MPSCRDVQLSSLVHDLGSTQAEVRNGGPGHTPVPPLDRRGTHSTRLGSLGAVVEPLSSPSSAPETLGTNPKSEAGRDS